MGHFIVTNGYGARTKQPFVTLTEESKDFMVQMSPEEAVSLATNLITCAEASIQDGFLVEFLRDKEIEDSYIGAMLEQFRQWRTQRDEAYGEQEIK